MKIKFKKLKEEAIQIYKRYSDSWYDLAIPYTTYLQPNTSTIIPLWFAIELPEGYDMVIYNRSSIASNKKVIVWACVIDNWYRWEIMVNLINLSKDTIRFEKWDKIAQGVVRKVEDCEVEIVEDLTETERWDGWFWSTWR